MVRRERSPSQKRRKVTHYNINKRRKRDYFSFFMKKGVPLQPQKEKIQYQI